MEFWKEILFGFVFPDKPVLLLLQCFHLSALEWLISVNELHDS